MLVTNKELQHAAKKGKYAVGAFNTSNIEITQAIIEAHEEMNAPVIIATSTSAIKYCGIEVLSAVVRQMAWQAKIPISLHLDHGTDFNLKITKMGHAVGVSVEAELGRLGGIEDNISVDERDARLTDPDEAERFVKETECDTLAIAIGTSHGAYKFKGEAKLAFDRLEEIGNRIDVPLVLHGASSVIPEIIEKANKYGANLGAAKGVPVEDIKKAISLGITKVNIDTDLRLAFTAGVRKILSEKPELFDPRKIIGAGRSDIKEVVRSKIEILGCAGKA